MAELMALIGRIRENFTWRKSARKVEHIVRIRKFSIIYDV